MTRTQAAELELIELARARDISWTAIAVALHPKMTRWEAKRRYQELRRLSRLEEAGVISG
jgi:hypothetical protein